MFRNSIRAFIRESLSFLGRIFPVILALFVTPGDKIKLRNMMIARIIVPEPAKKIVWNNHF